MLKKFLKFCGIFSIACAYSFIKEFCQPMITGKQPSSKGNSICLIVKSFRIQLIEMIKLRILKYVSMYSCNSIGWETVMNVYMSHVYSVLIIYNLNLRIFVVLSDSIVKFLDYRYKYRHNLFKVS